MGKAYEDRNQYAESWRFYERGNALKRAETCYRPEIIEDNMHQHIDVFTAAFFAARGSVGTPNADPIFIVGLPRSGSTLVEQILASHSQIEGTRSPSLRNSSGGELGNYIRVARVVDIGQRNAFSTQSLREKHTFMFPEKLSSRMHSAHQHRIPVFGLAHTSRKWAR